jgi:hypothetical protein
MVTRYLDMVKVAARGPNTCALSKDGKVYVWGEPVPKVVDSIPQKMVDLCCGNAHYLSIDGTSTPENSLKT